MKVLTCEMCGGRDLIKDGGVFVCQSCGTKYSVEEAKKMMVEGTVNVEGTVKIDTSSELKNLYEIARRAKESDNSDNALKYYDMIMVKDPSSWEANFYVVYFKAMGCRIADIWSAGNSMTNCIEPVLSLVKENVTDSEERSKVVSEIYARCTTIASMLSNAARNHFEGIDASIQGQYIQEYVNNASGASDIMYKLGDTLESLFGDSYGTVAASAWKDAIRIHNTYLKYLADKDANKAKMLKYVESVKKYDSSYAAPEFQTGGCYIATAVYGSYDCPEVWTLRRFRDYTLAETWPGRAFIKTYYAISPTLVKWFGETEWFKLMWRGPLDRLVSRLHSEGVKDTPYND